MAELPTTYEAARTSDITALRRLLLDLGSAPARMVGTGGTLPVAILAGQLHETLSRQPARTMTPLELLQTPMSQRSGAVLFSARAKHPDARLVLDRLALDSYQPAALVTHRPVAQLWDEVDPAITLVHLPPPGIPEGFLATNSVVAMSASLIRAALGDVLPEGLAAGAAQLAGEVALRERLLILYPPALAAVAADIETRCAELGVAAVQTSDLRNIAHGRHTGLARVADRTSVVVLSDQLSGPLADAVRTPLEASGAAIARWHVDRAWPEAMMMQLMASMHLTSRLAPDGLDPARPKVPEFGRRLYNLPLRRLLAPYVPSPVDRKLAAVGAGTTAGSIRSRYETAWADWCAELRRTEFRGIVVDYDGTICETSQRFDPPSVEIQRSLIRLLESGLQVAFASGRGKSLHEGLREWVPESLHRLVTVGMYNGAQMFALDASLPDLTQPSELMERVASRLNASELAGMVVIEARQHQVGVSADIGTLFHFQRLSQLVRDILSRAPSLPAQVVSSGHSVDVISDATSKVSVYDALHGATDAAVLVIGDQGDSGGNDFALLDASPWSISVDRCSSNPTRCWNVDPAGRRGPSNTRAVLDAMELADGVARLDVQRIRKGRRARA